MKKAKGVVYQLVRGADALDPRARVACAASGEGALATLRYELTRAKGNTCADCALVNPVIRKVTIEVLEVE